MDDQEYKEKLKAFRTSCRIYRQEKKILETAGNSTDPMLTGFIREDVERVDNILSLIREHFGASAALLIWMLYVEEKTQTDAAYQLGITRRQLQYSVSEFMHYVFNKEIENAGG